MYQFNRYSSCLVPVLQRLSVFLYAIIIKLPLRLHLVMQINQVLFNSCKLSCSKVTFSLFSLFILKLYKSNPTIIPAGQLSLSLSLNCYFLVKLLLSIPGTAIYKGTQAAPAFDLLYVI